MKRAGDAMAENACTVNCDLAGENELLGRVAYMIRGGRLIPVPAELNLAERWTAKIVRSSVPAARALVFIHRMIHARKKLASKDAVPCQS
jgi:hypothetical protein